MAILTGKDGEFKFGGNNVARVRSFTLESNLNLIEVTNLGQRETNTEPGLRSYTGTATIMYDDDNARLTSILTKLFAGSNTESVPANANFKFGSDNVTGDVFVTSASIGVSAGEIITADVSFTFKGPLTNINL